MKWIWVFVLVLMLAGSAGAMAPSESTNQEQAVQEQIQTMEQEQIMEQEQTMEQEQAMVQEKKESNETEITTANTSTGKDSSLLESEESGEAEEVSAEEGAPVKQITPVMVSKWRISERLRERIIKKVGMPHMEIKGEKQKLIRLKQTIQTRVHDVRHAAIEAANKYAKAKEDYLKAKSMKDRRVQARLMLHTGSLYAERWLDRIELEVMNSEGMSDETKLAILDRIDEFRAEIQEKRDRLNNTTSLEEIRAVSKELNDYWIEARLFIKSVVYQLVAAKLEVLIDNAEDVELRLQEKIEEMKASGIDTAKLEELLSDYENNIELARENVEKAEELLLNATSNDEIREGHKLIIDASFYLKEAFKDVRLMVKEYRKGTFFGNGTGEIFAKGDGKALINGTGIVVVQGNGTMTVEPDTAVKAATGFGVKTTGNGVSEFKGRGVVVVRGENVTVTIEGTNLKIFAKGSGSVYLEGTGTYKVKKLPKSEMTEEEYDGEVTIEFGVSEG